MIYVVIMAVAFVAFVSLATVLIVTKIKEKRAFLPEEEEPELYTVDQKGRKENKKDDFQDYYDFSEIQDQEDFGYSEKNPVFTSSSAAAERYLAALRTEKGEGLRWTREGTVAVKKLKQMSNVNVECYTLYLYGREYRTIYICPSGRKNTNEAPKGLILATDGKRLSYNGSIALEAKEKGITEEQVLEKYAFVYENKRPLDSDNSKSDSERDVKKEFYSEPETVSYRKVGKPVNSSPAQVEKKPEQHAAQKAEAKQPSSFPNYLPGFEPEEMKPALDKFLAVIDREYPDGIIKRDTWDHAKWDRAASMLCKFLGYANGTEFLEAYGYTVED